MSRYDTVFVGFPIWWYVEPRIIDTFLETHDLSGKTVVPFATSGGSGLGRAPQHMATLAPGATVTEGPGSTAARTLTSCAHGYPRHRAYNARLYTDG